MRCPLIGSQPFHFLRRAPGAQDAQLHPTHGCDLGNAIELGPSEPVGRLSCVLTGGSAGILQPPFGDGVVGTVAANGLQALAEAFDEGIRGMRAESHIQSCAITEVS